MKVLGTFGKAIEHNRHLSFGISGGNNCDRSCTWLNNGCYAQRVENYRANTVGQKQSRHEATRAVNLLNLAEYELSTVKRLDWFRFSAFGSLPKRTTSRSKPFRNALRRFARSVIALTGTARRVHLPVESYKKAKEYRQILRSTDIVVRESLQSVDRLNDYKHQASIVIGSWDQKPDERIQEAKRVVDQQRQQGKKAIVCPAVVSDSKCGKCIACASLCVDLVVYPLHK